MVSLPLDLPFEFVVLNRPKIPSSLSSCFECFPQCLTVHGYFYQRVCSVKSIHGLKVKQIDRHCEVENLRRHSIPLMFLLNGSRDLPMLVQDGYS